MPRRRKPPRLDFIAKPGREPTYIIRWRDADGERREKHLGTTDPRRAEDALAEFLGEQADARRAGSGDSDQVTVRHVLLAYAAGHGATVGAPETMAEAIEVMLPFLGDKPVGAITAELCRAYWAWRRRHSVRKLPDESRIVVELPPARRDIGNGTIIRELAGTLRPALKHAVAAKMIPGPPPPISVPPTPKGKDLWLTREQAIQLLWRARDDKRARLHLPLLILLGLFLGGRRGALRELQWLQIDLVRGVVDLNPPGRAQTAKARPIVPIPRVLLAYLRMRQRTSNSPYVLSWHGGQLLNVKRSLASAARRAGIPFHVTPHVLRHTCGTWLAQGGVSMFQISGWLGHSVARTTELYAHHHPDYLTDARRALENRRIAAISTGTKAAG